VNLRCRARGEQGSTTTELVIAMPALLLLIMSIIQFGVWYHASHVAEAAAQEGVRAARVEGGSAAAGQTRAQEFVASAAPTLLVDVAVQSTRSTETARVEVTGTVRSIIPGLTLPVHTEAESPIETFRADTP
jgi:Flp pilus assembly protein TadG